MQYGWTPLNTAVREALSRDDDGHVEVVKVLLAAGANTEIADYFIDGEDVYVSACRAGVAGLFVACGRLGRQPLT